MTKTEEKYKNKTKKEISEMWHRGYVNYKRRHPDRLKESKRKYYSSHKKEVFEVGLNSLKRKRALINKIKNVPCADCHKKYPPYVMDFDHRRGTKKKGTVNGLRASASLKRVLTEISKCDVVCSNCHRIRTWKKMKG